MVKNIQELIEEKEYTKICSDRHFKKQSVLDKLDKVKSLEWDVDAACKMSTGYGYKYLNLDNSSIVDIAKANLILENLLSGSLLETIEYQKECRTNVLLKLLEESLYK